MSSPLNSILVGTSGRRASASALLTATVCAVLFLSPTSEARAADAASSKAQVVNDADARKAEKILAKLRLLHDAAAANDGGAYRAHASNLFPELFVKVAELRPSSLSTDLSTAVFLAEELGRSWSAAVDATADCSGERPDIYAPLCTALRGGTVRQLLLAKSRLHARWAEAVLKSRRGERNGETERALAEMNAARTNDYIIAGLILEALRRVEGLPQTARPRTVRVEDSGDAGADFTEALAESGALLAWMPRSPVFYRLSNARRAYADGLWWQSKARQAKSLVVSANNFQPNPLEEMKLSASQVSAAAAANWAAAAKQTRLAEQVLAQPETASR